MVLRRPPTAMTSAFVSPRDSLVYNIAGEHMPSSSPRIFEDDGFWVYKQPIVLYNLLDSRLVSLSSPHIAWMSGACPVGVACRRCSSTPRMGRRWLGACASR